MILPKISLNEHEKLDYLMTAVKASHGLHPMVAQFQVPSKDRAFEDVTTYVTTINGHLTTASNEATIKGNHHKSSVFAIDNSAQAQANERWCEYYKTKTHWTKDCRVSRNHVADGTSVDQRTQQPRRMVTIHREHAQQLNDSSLCFECGGSHFMKKGCPRYKARIIVGISREEYQRRIALFEHQETTSAVY